ncbi:hypothetical protein BDY17DRAFT_322821 [Neohortaea acidophila]|uniref:DUF1754-domain-containing protein n=1 Tax=Neohortaea acidophila TaxID=245834 RepID=A0A6A6PW13_9PEZI|nr:uncharacterized protein BDY17DRAFT_322821 [Neohortaea acidophila]KAF2483931.1 hypothetical protein BDY17DRAFT_322821 [Neohortaea acidophila]
MPSSEYANAVRGGLKLKGAKDSGGVKKHKKKEKKQSLSKSHADPPVTDTNRAEEEEKAESESALQKALLDEDGLDEDAMEGDGAGALRSESGVGKTEAQRRHEERRKKRLDERLKREGVKTHKERVEELNKYLSNLSEHHDMPRIGPG